MEPEGRENTSTCQPSSFPTRNMVHDTGQRDSGDTRTGKARLNSGKSKKESENGGGGDQV